MKLLSLIFILFLSTFTIAQTLSMEAIHNSGTFSGGDIKPNLDWNISLDMPMTTHVILTPSLAYSRTNYFYYRSEQEAFETHWYLGLKLTYVISSKPLLE